MNVIGFFGDLLENVGALVSFVTTDISTLYGAPIAVIGDWSILSILSVGIGVILAFAFGLHLFHLLKPIG